MLTTYQRSNNPTLSSNDVADVYVLHYILISAIVYAKYFQKSFIDLMHLICVYTLGDMCQINTS